MSHSVEIEFTRKVLKNMQLNSHIIINNQIPDNIDLGLRSYLGIEDDKSRMKSGMLDILEKNTILVVTDEFMCNYVLFALSDTLNSEIFICGPYITEEMTKQKLMHNAEKHNISPHLFAQFSRYYGNITLLSDTSCLLAIITGLAEAIWGNNNNLTIKKHRKEFADTQYSVNIGNLESIGEDALLTVNLIETRYESEKLMMDAVSKGQAHRIAHMLGYASEFVFETRTDDALRNAKNYMIVMNTLLRKAVQDGGVPPYFIDKLSSEFAKKIEACEGAKEIEILGAEMIEKYNNLVKEHSLRKYSSSVQKAMAIIDCDMTADLSLKAVSSALGINESYFSSLFRKETGKTFTDFVNGKRIEQAKKLILSSSLQIQTIAQHCGILDVNYFSKLFKKHCGMSPSEFRNENR